MKIAKPMLLVSTPIGLAWGLYEGWQLAGGLVVLMFAMIAVLASAFGLLVHTIRREKADAQGCAPGTSGSGRD
ncbi:MAG: hypothetical protein O9284_14855 [Steroidobacteraceae bacterium]|jgi:hypothetical protein|nr:hypothetical protein [Steroidobacteraceae bacterium]